MLSQKINHLLCTTFLLNLSITIVGMETTYTPKALVANPVEYLIKSKVASDEFCKDARSLLNQKNYSLDLTKLIQDYSTLAQKHEQEYPLFFIRECTEDDNPKHNDHCLLSRLYRPYPRASFDTYASQLLINKLRTSATTSAIYTDFASGDIFQTLVVMTKTLIELPKAQLTIHCIDDNNTCYVHAIDFLNNSRKVTTDPISFNLSSRIEEYVKHARNQAKDVLRIQYIWALTTAELHKQFLLNYLFKEVQCKQFLSWLRQKFPLAHVSLYIHDQIDSYYDFLEKNGFAHADIVTTTDIDDDQSIKMKSHDDYKLLCIKTLINKPNAKTAWLKKLDEDNIGILTAASLSDTKNSTEIDFNIIKL